MPTDRNEVEAEWAELEAAVERGDWATASELAREFEQEWKTVRSFVELFAGPGADVWGRLVDKAMASLLEALRAGLVDPVAVDGAMARFRMFMP